MQTKIEIAVVLSSSVNDGSDAQIIKYQCELVARLLPDICNKIGAEILCTNGAAADIVVVGLSMPINLRRTLSAEIKRREKGVGFFSGKRINHTLVKIPWSKYPGQNTLGQNTLGQYLKKEAR